MKRRMPFGARLLVGWWLVVIVCGLLFNFWLALIAFRSGMLAGGVLFSALGVGCAVLCYRTYASWDEFPRHRREMR
jgi:hypothetical protein